MANPFSHLTDSYNLLSSALVDPDSIEKAETPAPKPGLSAEAKQAYSRCLLSMKGTASGKAAQTICTNYALAFDELLPNGSGVGDLSKATTTADLRADVGEPSASVLLTQSKKKKSKSGGNHD